MFKHLGTSKIKKIIAVFRDDLPRHRETATDRAVGPRSPTRHKWQHTSGRIKSQIHELHCHIASLSWAQKYKYELATTSLDKCDVMWCDVMWCYVVEISIALPRNDWEGQLVHQTRCLERLRASLGGQTDQGPVDAQLLLPVIVIQIVRAVGSYSNYLSGIISIPACRREKEEKR